MKRTRAAAVALFGVAALFLYPGTAFGQELDIGVCAPGGGNTFSLNINNPYFPMNVGETWRYTGEDDGPKGLEITVLGTIKTVTIGKQTVDTRVLRETEWADTVVANGQLDEGEDLSEISLNYFAQSQDGTVCYFGEDVDIFEGKKVSHAGSWLAGKRNARAGIFMPAEPKKGMSFAQESAKNAQDFAEITDDKLNVQVEAGTFHQVIEVKETNLLDGDVGFKYYAPGVGLIIDGDLELISHSL